MYEEITEAIPRVKVISGRKGDNGRIFIDGRELITAETIDVHTEKGSFAEVTVKFTALIVEDEPKKPNEITVKVNVDTSEAQEKLDMITQGIRKIQALRQGWR
jgi:hypothetical protein